MDRLISRLLHEPLQWSLIVSLVLLFILSFIFLSDIHVGSDGFSYYAYVRSAVLDGDLNFYNEDGNYNLPRHPMSPYWMRADTGYVNTLFSIGPAILWLPFFLIGHGWALAAHLPANGFSFPYVFMTVLGTGIYGFLGLLLSYRIALSYTSPPAARLATLGVWFGTALTNYLYKDPTFAHAGSAFAVSLFLYVWHQTRDRRSPRDACILGITGGLMALTRWQNVLFFLVPAMEALGGLWAAWRARSLARAVPIVSNNALFLATSLLAFTPQMLAWKVILGQFVLIPQGGEALHWSSPKILQVIFSPYHGLFTYTPLTAMAVLGLMYYLFRRERLLATALLLTLALQIYVNASFVDWWAGYSFGMRRLVNCSPLFILGLAALFDGVKRPHLKKTILILSLILVVWNLNLVVQVGRRGLLDPEDRTIGFYLDAVANVPRILEQPQNLLWFPGYSYLPTLVLGLFQLDPVIVISVILLTGAWGCLALLLQIARMQRYRLVSAGIALLGLGIVLTDLFIIHSGTHTRLVHATHLGIPSAPLLPTRINPETVYESLAVQGDVVVNAAQDWETEIQSPIELQSLELLSYMEGPAQQGEAIAEIILSDSEDREERFVIRAGLDTAGPDRATGDGKTVPRQELTMILPQGTPVWVPYWLLPGYFDVQTCRYYFTRFNFHQPLYPRQVRVRFLKKEGSLHLGSLVFVQKDFALRTLPSPRQAEAGEWD